MKTVHEVLVDARNLIDRDGWVQGLGGYCGKHNVGARGPYCALGAIGAAVREQQRVHSDAVHPATAVVSEPIGGPQRFSRWNDTDGRTKEQVLAAFDAAISLTAPEPCDPLQGVETREPVAA